MIFVTMAGRILEEGADWMRSHIAEKRVVYVHCKSGIGRSASVVAAYFMKHRQMGAEEAVALVRRRRPKICKASSTQMTSLLAYEKTIRGDQRFSVQP